MSLLTAMALITEAPAPAQASAVRFVVSARAAAPGVVLGRPVTVRGRVSPGAPGAQVALQARVGGAWKQVASTRLTATSTYILRWKPTTAGRLNLRVSKAASRHTGAGTSANIVVRAAGKLAIAHPTSLPTGAAGTSYCSDLLASGGAQPIQFTATGLPPGLKVSATGVIHAVPDNVTYHAITGVPAGPSTSEVTLRATDAIGQTATRTLSLRVNPATSDPASGWCAHYGGTLGAAGLISCAPHPAAGPYCVKLSGGEFEKNGTAPWHIVGGSQTLSNGRWTTQNFATAPHESPGGGSDVTSLSCATSTFCAAVGVYESTKTPNVDQLFLAKYVNGRWSASTVPWPRGLQTAGAGDNLIDSHISCAGNGSCTAIGVGKWDNQVLLVQLSAGTWTARLMPYPDGSKDFQLDDLSCPTTTHCVAVGELHYEPLIDTLDGGIWSPTAMSAPTLEGSTDPNTLGRLDVVSCASSTACTAAGYGRDQNGGYWWLTEQLVDGQWVTTSAQTGFPADQDVFSDVYRYTLHQMTCTAAGDCVAVGSHQGKSANLGLIAGLSDGKWKVAAMPLPYGGRYFGELKSVACPTGNLCYAADAYDDYPLLERIGAL